MTPEMICGIIAIAGIFAALMIVLAVTGVLAEIADLVLPNIPAVARWIESLPMFAYQDELKQDEDYDYRRSVQRRVQRRRSAYRKTTHRGAVR